MNGARTTPWEGLVHCTGTVLDMEAVEDIDEACWLTITVERVTVELSIKHLSLTKSSYNNFLYPLGIAET